MTADRASQTTSLGEYAVALNCTITNAMENTIAVRPIMPDAMAVRIASAAPGSMPTVRSGKKRRSSRGSARPTTTADIAYISGTQNMRR